MTITPDKTSIASWYKSQGFWWSHKQDKATQTEEKKRKITETFQNVIRKKKLKVE